MALSRRFAAATRRVSDELLAVAFEQASGGVDTGQDRAGWAGGVCRPERALQPGGVDAIGVGQDQGRLGVRGQGLVSAGHHRVGANGNGVKRKVRVEAEVRCRGSIYDQRYAVRVRHPGVPGDVAEGADVGRVAQEDRTHLRVRSRGRFDVGYRYGNGQPGRGVDLRADPDRLDPG